MDPNISTQPTQPTQAEIPAQRPLSPKKNNKKIVFWIFAILLFLIAFVVGGFFTGAKQNKPSIRSQQKTVTPTPDRTANWKTYVDAKWGFIAKYPPSWTANAPYVNDQSKYQTAIPSFMAKDYQVGFTIPNLNNSEINQGPLTVGIAVYDNPQDWNIATWVNKIKATSGGSLSGSYENIIINGITALKTRQNPDFSDIFANYISPLNKNEVFVFSYGGNGEGGSNYNDNDPFVQTGLGNFNTLLSTFKFTN